MRISPENFDRIIEMFNHRFPFFEAVVFNHGFLFVVSLYFPQETLHALLKRRVIAPDSLEEIASGSYDLEKGRIPTAVF